MAAGEVMKMRDRMLIIVSALLTLIVASCDRPNELAPTGANPPVRTPVGPIPGAPVTEPKPRANPYAQDPIALADGRRLFVWFNCYGCHGGHAGGGMGPSLRDVTWIYGNSDANIFNSIAEGRANGMPAWGTKLPEDQIWKIVAYIKSMRTPLEPQPPIP
jgi:cytochrome c oxidase cbb3-type subunit III